MLLSSLVSVIYKDGVTLQLFLSGITVILLGISAMIFTRNHKKEMNKREGYIVVTFGWLIMALSGTLPYIFTDTISSFTNAFFETISGYTTNPEQRQNGHGKNDNTHAAYPLREATPK